MISWPLICKMLQIADAAKELLRRRAARLRLLEYITYTNPKYKVSLFSQIVCAALDQFIQDVVAGKRPILVLQAPPQHGKTEIVSRKFPCFLMGLFPDLRIGGASYNDEFANNVAQDVRRNLADTPHKRLFPVALEKRRYDVNRTGEFTAPGGTGSYIGVGVGSGLTGRPLDIGIIDDPIKNEKEALSTTVKEGHWNWYQAVFTTRLSENSGQIIMATSWAEDDLVGRICKEFEGDSRLIVLRFPAINLPGETGYNPVLPEGALVPELKSLKFLQEVKKLFSEYWWCAMYQQNPRPIGGNVFKAVGPMRYRRSELPKKFDKVIASVDCTFKDTDGTDYVVGQIWGKYGANSYLLAQSRDRMSFTATCDMIRQLYDRWRPRVTLIEDKANGPAVIDTLKKSIPGLLPIEPDGSKLARAHAVTSYWEAGNVWLPEEDEAPWIKDYLSELLGFPASANDDQVDGTTQALRHLYPAFGQLKIAQEALAKAQQRR